MTYYLITCTCSVVLAGLVTSADVVVVLTTATVVVVKSDGSTGVVLVNNGVISLEVDVTGMVELDVVTAIGLASLITCTIGRTPWAFSIVISEIFSASFHFFPIPIRHLFTDPSQLRFFFLSSAAYSI